jgi:hypothetical protein
MNKSLINIKQTIINKLEDEINSKESSDTIKRKEKYLK